VVLLLGRDGEFDRLTVASLPERTDAAFARDVSNRIVFLHQGCVEEQGDPRDLFTRPQSDRFRQFLSASRDAT
jgi:ABC-type histidine transport system ATPase subunit